MKQLVLEVVRINEDVISTSGMCKYVNSSPYHYYISSIVDNEGYMIAHQEYWQYSETDGWSYTSDFPQAVENLELIYNNEVNEGDMFHYVDGQYIKCTDDHSELFSLRED